MDPRRNAADRSVLLVEDDPSSLAAMVEVLLRDGYRVTTASTGAEALEAARRVRFDAFVIDVFLPDAGGLGVARALGQERGDGTLPVLFVTALSTPAVRDALWPAPVLWKPLHRRDLLEAVQGVMRAPADVRSGERPRAAV